MLQLQTIIFNFFEKKLCLNELNFYNLFIQICTPEKKI